MWRKDFLLHRTISGKLYGFLLIFSTGFTSLSVLLPFSSLYTVDSISSHIDEVLSINASADLLVFGDFNVHHKDWLTNSGGTDKPGELWFNFSISNDHTQMVNFPTRISDCDSHSPALLDLFYTRFLSTGKLWSCSWLSLCWLSIKLKTGCPVSPYNLWLFSCWLEASSWSFERYSMGRYL